MENLTRSFPETREKNVCTCIASWPLLEHKAGTDASRHHERWSRSNLCVSFSLLCIRTQLKVSSACTVAGSWNIHHRCHPAFLRKQFVSWGNQLLQESASPVMRAQVFCWGCQLTRDEPQKFQTTPITRSKILLGKVSIIDQNPTANMTPCIPSIFDAIFQKDSSPQESSCCCPSSAPSCHQLHRHLGSDRLSNLLQRTPARTTITQCCKKERSLKMIAQGEETRELLKPQSFLFNHRVQVMAPNRIHITFIFSGPNFDRKFSSKSCTHQVLLDHSKPSLTTVHMKTSIGHLKIK
jgi:hypothetical protein